MSAPAPWTPSERWFKPREAARYAGISRQTLVVWVKTRGLACEMTKAGHHRYSKSSLDALLAAPKPKRNLSGLRHWRNR